ncbi:MAG: hybrid sensor histidine kinase/response regulator [Magnetococcales bacterium]|nr:hybrid sensor histidine kinase/response regulator [Magnetococcales bacterium]
MMPDTVALPVVLIVDDTPENLDVLKGILKTDYAIRLATSGTVALRVARVPPHPDLVLLDIMMPGIDGYEVCRQLKADALTRDIPVLFVSAKSEEVDELQGLALGAVDYITKPISPPILKSRVRTHLQLRRAYQQLERQNADLIAADQLKQQVDMIVRHDMKSPLNGIIGFADLLLEQGHLAPEQRETVQSIRHGGVNALHMINLSLGLYRMELGTYQLEAKPVDLTPILRRIRADLRSWLIQNQLTWTMTVTGQPVTAADNFVVLGEEVLCYSMLANLIKNAVEASPPGQVITIALEMVDTTAVVRIHNQSSVPEPIRNCFFDKNVTYGKKSGTGLGTYSAKLIVETMTGTIAMHSSAEEGTEIRVALPAPATGQATRTKLGPAGQGMVQDQPIVHQADFAVAAQPHLYHLQQALERHDTYEALNEIEWLIKTAIAVAAQPVVVQSTRLNGKVEMEEWSEAGSVYQKLVQQLARLGGDHAES